MKARDVMNRHVVSVAPDETILEAGELMLRHHVSGAAGC
jgi:CBS domain-containing protein